jgi:hypothetical protein
MSGYSREYYGWCILENAPAFAIAITEGGILAGTARNIKVERECKCEQVWQSIQLLA